MFQSPTGRAVGVGYVEEIKARLHHHLITKPTAQINVTLDSNPKTFPLHQALNFDFSHDTNIAGILTAFGTSNPCNAALLASEKLSPAIAATQTI